MIIFYLGKTSFLHTLLEEKQECALDIEKKLLDSIEFW